MTDSYTLTNEVSKHILMLLGIGRYHMEHLCDMDIILEITLYIVVFEGMIINFPDSFRNVLNVDLPGSVFSKCILPEQTVVQFQPW